jgi:hypothetical protein
LAKFSKNTISQVSGFDNPVIAGELVYNQKTYWNLTLTAADSTGTQQPVDLTGVTINAQIIRRTVTDLTDTRNGLVFTIGNFTPTPTAIPLTVSNIVTAAGSFTVTIDDSTWGLLTTDAELDISVQDPVCFSGRIKISFPANSPTPAEDNIIFLMFLVRSDGIVKV